MIEACERESTAPVDVLDGLEEAQEGAGRHQCAVCAYARGKRDAKAGLPLVQSGDRCKHGSVAPNNLFDELHENQGGHARHKCVCCAYREGYSDGIVGSLQTS